MTTVTNIRPTALALPEIVGYVEALTGDRVLGWAWSPACPETRVSIELYVGDHLVATTIADLARPDLESNGIGDGRHAYDLEIPAEFRQRTAELRIFGRAVNGEAMPIGSPPIKDGLPNQVSRLQQGMDTLVSSQRLIHRNLQAALTATRGNEEANITATLARLADLQAGTETQLGVIERFVTRLDAQLTRLTPDDLKGADKGQSVPSAALWALGVAGGALIISVLGLVRSLGG